MVYKPFICYFITLLLLMAGQALHAQPSDKPYQSFVVSGVIINSDNADLIKRFSDYLSIHADYPLHVTYVNKYSELSRELLENPKAIGWTCGAPFVQDNESVGQQLIAVPLFHNKPTYFSIVLSRSNRSEKKLADFKGGVLAYSDPRSNSGFLAPKYALFKQGIDMETHFRLLMNAGNHEGSINALLNNLADVAAVDEYVWVAYQSAHPEAKKALHELEHMGPFPFTPIVAGNKVSPDSIRRLTAALSDMRNDAEGRQLLSEFHLDGFVEKTPAFYQPIKNMLTEVSIETGQ